MYTDHKIIGLCSRLKFCNFPEFGSASYWCSKLLVNVPVHVSILWSSTTATEYLSFLLGYFADQTKNFHQLGIAAKPLTKHSVTFFNVILTSKIKKEVKKPILLHKQWSFFAAFLLQLSQIVIFYPYQPRYNTINHLK